MVLSDEIINEILIYLEKSIKNLAKESLENLEIQGGNEELEEFLQSQFDIRLENLLVSKNSSIHHLESGMKNKVIQQKKKIIDRILKNTR
ncbi:MAG: hypothetical protein K5790_03625 [Nitrosopumilus sp.]|uniref:hypothetical protein n=1 Tax=Nitrosopumilus sp. TaxID=2024843 RepID=UPI00247CEBCD|nr:hypothetical protein [Nitrosopumilus sp.]MCV0392369.1 hypothetical protein [Nitrosopumilus sp.]